MGEHVPDVTYEIPRWYFPRRFNVVILSLFAITLAYMMRANLSIAILEMTVQFNWPLSEKGMFLSAFFWGYITTQLIGGMAARKFGPKNMILFVIVVPSILTMCIPFVAPRSSIAFVICRVLTGVASGATFPTMFLMLSGWIPFSEKASCLAIVFAGSNFGTIIIDTVGPVIMNALGWQYVFFFSGGAGFIWMIFWFLTVADTPQQMTNIHPSEVKYIVETSESTPLLPNQKINNYTEPEEELDGADYKPVGVGKGASMGNVEALKKLAQTASFWNIVFCGFCTNWGSYIFLTWLPYYVHTDLGYDVQWAGVIAILPNISSSCVSFVAGKLCDVVLMRGYNKLRVRKTFFITGSFLYGSTLVLLALRNRFHLSDTLSTIILAIGTGGAGLHLPGYTANIYDIAPFHPSIVVGISNTAGTIPGIVGVSLVGILLQLGLGWPTIWLLTASFYALASISCFFFADVKRVV